MLTLVSAPATMPVTLIEAKKHLRVDHSDDDDLIEIYIKAATDYVDGPTGFLGQALVDQTWDLYLDAFPASEIDIQLPPVIAIVGVFYADGDNVEQEVDSSDYVLDTAGYWPRVIPAGSFSWPATYTKTSAVRVRFRAGYVNASTSPDSGEIPFGIKAGILLNIGSLYEHRETVVVGQTPTTLPWGAEQLFRQYRKHLSLA